jgi:hypothetical protein
MDLDREGAGSQLVSRARRPSRLPVDIAEEGGTGGESKLLQIAAAFAYCDDVQILDRCTRVSIFAIN